MEMSFLCELSKNKNKLEEFLMFVLCFSDSKTKAGYISPLSLTDLIEFTLFVNRASIGFHIFKHCVCMIMCCGENILYSFLVTYCSSCSEASCTSWLGK